MIQCIKTGFVIYIKEMNQYTRMDLFYDLNDLYSNQNDLFNGKPNIIDIECDNIEWGGEYYKIINPIIHQRLIDYVNDMKFKGMHEHKFLVTYSDGAIS